MNQVIATIKESHPALKGHFPGNPIVPAAVMLQTVEEAISSFSDNKRSCGLSRTRFRALLKIGFPFKICLEEKEQDRFRVEIQQDGVVVMTGTMLVCSQ